MSRWITKFLEKKSEIQPDKPDRFTIKTNMSVMSGPSKDHFSKNLRKFSGAQPDKPDGFNLKTNMSVMSGLSGPLRETFEERLAIAEHDGGQTPLQSQRIAYLDAFISVLLRPQSDSLLLSGENWFDHKIISAKDWLKKQGMKLPE